MTDISAGYAIPKKRNFELAFALWGTLRALGHQLWLIAQWKYLSGEHGIVFVTNENIYYRMLGFDGQLWRGHHPDHGAIEVSSVRILRIESASSAGY